MDSLNESIDFWLSVIGTIVGIYGLVQSETWVAFLGLVAAVGFLAVAAYARRERQRLRLASVTVEGRTVDCLNLASLQRRLNRSLGIERAEHVAVVSGDDLTVTWHYSGHCRAARESAIEFSIDADCSVPFENLECTGHDLVHDPRKRHDIRPILLGTDGISKKVAVPFLTPLAFGDRFDLLLTCVLPGCMKAGLEYCTATTSFEQERIPDYSMRLVFDGGKPEWVRVYECASSGNTRLLKELRPQRATQPRTVYLDAATDMSARSARIYVFRRRAFAVRQTPVDDRSGRLAA
jgi:hypothetical protein